MMSSPFYPSASPDPELAGLVEAYRRHGDVGVVMDQLRAYSKGKSPSARKAAAAPYKDLAEVVIPIYEAVVSQAPDDAQAMVILANAYWLTGRGPDVVGELASRAMAADRTNRGAWHL